MVMMASEVPEGAAEGAGEAEGEGVGEGAAEEAGMELLGAIELGAGALVSGMVMGTPAALQVDSTAAMAERWSAVEQALWTQGWTLARSWSPFLQWQAKSVRFWQPSLVRGPMKQLRAH